MRNHPWQWKVLTSDEERRRLVQEDGLPGEVDLVCIDFLTSVESTSCLNRCREVLIRVIDSARERWPSDDEWRFLLPPWFVRSSAAMRTQEELEDWLHLWRMKSAEERAKFEEESPWTLPDWLFWLHPSERQWWWWQGEPTGIDSARVLLVVSGYPAPLGAIQWLIRVAGGHDLRVTWPSDLPRSS